MSRTLRLVWMLVMLLLALPAMQASACAPDQAGHGAQQARAAHHGHHKQQQAPAPSQPRHECIGCVAPIDIGTYRPVERLSYALDRAGRRTQSIIPASRNAPPDPPPPRQSA